MDALYSFKNYAITKGYEASIVDDHVMLKNVVNPDNDFKIIKVEDYYAVITTRISKQDYEYLAKCNVYMLLAEYNQSNGKSTHLHINYKVQL